MRSAAPATREDLERVHTLKYLNDFKSISDIDGGEVIPFSTTPFTKGGYELASLSSGLVIGALRSVLLGEQKNAYALARPPGHHCLPDKGMGFCLLANISIAIENARSSGLAERFAVVDWDVHHGNGTQDIFYEDDSVFFFSTHQSPWYPGTGSREETGTGKGLGNTLNLPFPSGSGKKEIVDYAFGTELPKKMVQFKPELILISAGFDSRIDDPLGQFKLTDQDFFTLTKIILNIARDYGDSRVLSVLEGGYNLEGLASASVSHLQAYIQENS